MTTSELSLVSITTAVVVNPMIGVPTVFLVGLDKNGVVWNKHPDGKWEQVSMEIEHDIDRLQDSDDE